MITNNKSIVDFDFYSLDRVFILDIDKDEAFQTFLNKSIFPLSDEVLFRYSPDVMLKRLINNSIGD